VACNRCERTFEAQPLSRSSRLGELLLIVAAIAIGGIVAWLLVRNQR
jgi:hypothetical protein